MAGQSKRLFSAERGKLSQRSKDATLADVMDAIQSLDDSISNKIFNHLENLDEKGAASEEDATTPVEEIMAEIHNLNDHITATKQEIAALKTTDETDTPIATATEELAEVVKTTEEAANAILENAELIDGVVAELRAKFQKATLMRSAQMSKNWSLSAWN
jgi:chemotaxis regulatin CheY-phosphate phosphatase CheZ